MRRVLAIGALLALTMTGCELRGEISVNDDGSGTFTMAFGIDKQFRALLGGPTGEDPLAAMRKDLADDPVKWNVKEYKRGDVSGLTASFGFSSVEDLKAKMRALSSNANSQNAFGDFTLEKRDGDWVFSGHPGEPAGLADTPLPPDKIDELVDLQLRVSLPGKAGSSNADETHFSNGRTTFVWKPRLADAARATKPLEARTVPTGASFPAAPLAVGAALLLLIGTVAIAARRRTATPERVVYYMEPTPADLPANGSEARGDPLEEPQTEEAVEA